MSSIIDCVGPTRGCFWPTGTVPRHNPKDYLYADPDLGIDATSLLRRIPLDNGLMLSHLTSSSPSASRGPLGTMPNEINALILESMDIATLTTMRSVNKIWRTLVDSNTQYCQLVTKIPDLLRLVIATKTASAHTMADLLALRYQNRCRYCKKPSNYIDIIAAAYVCRPCNLKHRKKPATLRSVMYRTGLKEKRVRELVPVLDTIPGSYSDEYTPAEQKHFVAMEDVEWLFKKKLGRRAGNAWACRNRLGNHVKLVWMVLAADVGL